MRGLLILALITAAVLGVGAARVSAEAGTIVIGYLEVEDDPRYREQRPYAGIVVRTVARPYAGAELAIEKSRIRGRAIETRFELERFRGASADDLVAAIDRMRRERGVSFFLIDAQPEVIANVADRTRGRPVRLLNVAEKSDALRGELCQRHLLHLIPSHAMLMDALAQFIVARKWLDVFVLTGPSPEDAKMTEAFERSARRFGARIVARKDFVLSNDPRQRDKTNVSLMTAGKRYDVIFLADGVGEFGRYVPYDTSLPRPVIGTEGLVASAWYWAWERHGAPQLNQRFHRLAQRAMTDIDWAAWAGIRAIVESAVRTRSRDFASIARYLDSEDLTLDGYKGQPQNFRPWNNQMRQAILLHTHNAVLERAPLRGFLHATNDLDTLGWDQSETECRL